VRPNTNFGLYLTIWDRVLGTSDPTYEARFEEATRPSRDEIPRHRTAASNARARAS
jgi:sterol desaturase/sphingolipid hydroxylase (fatty acid hydroxylase superfamily)